MNPRDFARRMGSRVLPESDKIALDRNPDMITGVPIDTHPRGIRNTKFRLPYLSNLKKMDPVFDDPYEVAAQTIRKTRKPGDPEIVIDPDGLYEYDDSDGGPPLNQEDLPRTLQGDNYDKIGKVEQWESVVAATGMTEEYIRTLMIRPLHRNFVNNQTRNGKTYSVFVLSVAGNGNGLVGFGEGKSEESSSAEHVANMRAIQHMVPIPRYEGRTVFGEIQGKFGACKVTLRARPPGFGVRANYYVYEVCRCAGISDISAKVDGSQNGMNIVKAVFEALRLQKLPSAIAKERGRHVIDVRERYFHGR